MSSLQNFAPVLIHWSFGSTILVGLVSSEFTGAETLLAIVLASCTSILSALCSCKAPPDDEQFKRRRLSNLLGFLVIWLDVLTNLVAASTCARLASATVDYISRGHFREFLFGLEQHSLGEPWPDVLGVTIVLVVTALFMLGLERSSVISALLLLVVLCNFSFFAIIGSCHTINKFDKWFGNLKVHSYRTILKASAICSFGFVQKISMSQRNNCLKLSTLFVGPLLVYTTVAVIFSLMTHYRELIGTAIPLIQVFENRDVDWARPAIAVFTICVSCLLLTEITPYVYFAFVRLASREWRVLVGSIQFQSSATGAPVLAIFAAGSLAAILAFACPLSHLIKLLNVACLINCAVRSCQAVAARYKAEIIHGDFQVQSTHVQYSKLGQNSGRKSTTKHHEVTLRERIQGVFGKKPVYIHRLSSPKNLRHVGKGTVKKQEERQCLIEDGGSSLALDMAEDSNSENEENEMDVLSCSDGDDSGSSTDIDVIVEEYKEGLKVAAVGKFNDKRPATKLTYTAVVACLFFIVLASIGIALNIYQVVHFCWPYLLAIGACAVIITSMPANASDKSRPCLLPSLAFAVAHALSIAANVALASTLVPDVWQGIVFWTLAGLVLYWKCDCCNCEGLEPVVAKATAKLGPQEYKEHLTENIYIAR